LLRGITRLLTVGDQHDGIGDRLSSRLEVGRRLLEGIGDRGPAGWLDGLDLLQEDIRENAGYRHQQLRSTATNRLASLGVVTLVPVDPQSDIDSVSVRQIGDDLT
jgi:hypothetical protein